jgi:hypothetical protein
VLDLLEAFLGPAPLSPEQLHQLQLQHQLRHAQAALAHSRGGGGLGLSTTTTNPNSGGGEAAEWRVELAPLAELASEKLKNILLVLSAAGAFEPGEETIGAELWQLTWAVVEGRFRFCPGLRGELFGGEEGQPQQQRQSAPGEAVPPMQGPEPEQEQRRQQGPLVVAGEEVMVTEPVPPEEQEGEEQQSPSLQQPPPQYNGQSEAPAGGGDVVSDRAWVVVGSIACTPAGVVVTSRTNFYNQCILTPPPHDTTSHP